MFGLQVSTFHEAQRSQSDPALPENRSHCYTTQESSFFLRSCISNAGSQFLRHSPALVKNN